MEVYSIMPVLDYPYTLNIGSKSYPILRDGFSLKVCAGAEGKHRSSFCTLSVRGDDILNEIMYADGLIDAVVKDDNGNVLFTGVIRPYASITVNQTHLGNISLEVLELSEKMHVKVYESPEDEKEKVEGIIYSDVWDGYKVCAPDDTEHSIVHQLCALSGIAVNNAPVIDTVVYRFSLEYGDYLDEKLSKLLYEFVYDYGFDEHGNIFFFQTGPIVTDTDNGGEPMVSDLEMKGTVDSFLGKLTVSRADDTKQGILISYPKFETQKNVEIYRETRSSYSLILDIHPGWWIQDYKDVQWDLSKVKPGVKDVILSNFWMSYDDQSWGTGSIWMVESDMKNCDSEGGTISWQIGMMGGLIFNTIKGGPVVYADASFLVDTKNCGYAGENAESYSAQYLQTEEAALRLAYAINTRNTYNRYTYKFSSKEKLVPGQIYGLSEKALSGMNVTVRIISREMKDEHGVYSYEAEGYGEIAFVKPMMLSNDIQLQPTDVTFLNLTVSEDLITDDTDMDVNAVASGEIFERYGAVPRWYINQVQQTELSDKAVQLSKNKFYPGKNILRVSADYNGETYSLDKVITCITTVAVTFEMQFTLTDAGKRPGATAVWSEIQPIPGDGQVVWMRFKSSQDDTWTMLQATGKDGHDPIVYFQWATTPYYAPDEGWDLIAWGNTAIVWECSDGTLMGFAANDSNWETLVPEKPFGMNYLWVKYFNYQINDWDYFCTTGTPAMSFDIIFNPQTYKLTTRGVTKDGQKINVKCQKINTTAPVTWMISDGLEYDYPKQSDDSEIEIVIPEMTALPSFSITCSIADIDMSKECVVSGVQEGKAEEIYFGVVSSLDELNAIKNTSEGKLMVGDHAVVEINGARVPYYWNGSAWVMSDSETPANIKYKILNNSLYDALQKPTADAASIINLYAANLAAWDALLYRLVVFAIKIGTGTPSEGLYFRIMDINENGEKLPVPVFQCLYDGTNVFSIDFTGPQVIIGDYFNTGGLLWDAKQKQLYVKGTGTFQGTLDTLTIKTTKGDGITTYPAKDISNSKLLLDFIYTYTKNPNESVKASGTANNKEIVSVSLTSLKKTVFHHQDQFGILGLHSYDNYSCMVYYCDVVIVFADGSTAVYRKVAQWTESKIEKTTNKNNFPTPADPNWDMSDFIELSYVATISSRYSDSSTQDGYKALYPYELIDFALMDSTSERLLIENLPRQAPDELNRVWRDSEGYLRIV